MIALVHMNPPRSWRKLDKGLRLDPYRNILADHEAEIHFRRETLAEWELGERAGTWDDNDPDRWDDMRYDLGEF
jgi:hypothetical protein